MPKWWQKQRTSHKKSEHFFIYMFNFSVGHISVPVQVIRWQCFTLPNFTVTVQPHMIKVTFNPPTEITFPMTPGWNSVWMCGKPGVSYVVWKQSAAAVSNVWLAPQTSEKQSYKLTWICCVLNCTKGLLWGWCLVSTEPNEDFNGETPLELRLISQWP